MKLQALNIGNIFCFLQYYADINSPCFIRNLQYLFVSICWFLSFDMTDRKCHWYFCTCVSEICACLSALAVPRGIWCCYGSMSVRGCTLTEWWARWMSVDTDRPLWLLSRRNSPMMKRYHKHDLFIQGSEPNSWYQF